MEDYDFESAEKKGKKGKITKFRDHFNNEEKNEQKKKRKWYRKTKQKKDQEFEW